VIGYLLRPLTDWLQDLRSNAKERRRRREDFKRETLLALQGNLVQLDRAARAALRANPLQLQPLAHPAIAAQSAEEQALEQALIGVKMVRVRVDDADLRARILEFEAAAEAAAHPPTPEQVVHRVDALRSSFDQANERLGELLRALP
jgi:hypothetical protein